jgi:hypothetical protein
MGTYKVLIMLQHVPGQTNAATTRATPAWSAICAELKAAGLYTSTVRLTRNNRQAAVGERDTVRRVSNNTGASQMQTRLGKPAVAWMEVHAATAPTVPDLACA